MSTSSNGSIYTKVFWALIVATVVTVAISRIHLGTFGNISIGVAVAVAKASLVVLFFMHLKHEKRWWAGIVLFPLLLVMIIIGSNLPDTGLNGTETEGGEMTTPAVNTIPHAGRSGAAH